MFNSIDNFLICHKFYDHKYRRISAFAELRNNSLRIYVVTCSKNDTFSRKEARARLALYLEDGDKMGYKQSFSAIHPKIYSIPTTIDTYKHDFLQFLHEQFFLKEEMLVGVIGTNKMMVADVYGNTNTKEFHVVNPRIRIVPPKELAHYEEMCRREQEKEQQFEDFKSLVDKVNSPDNKNKSDRN